MFIELQYELSLIFQKVIFIVIFLYINGGIKVACFFLATAPLPLSIPYQ